MLFCFVLHWNIDYLVFPIGYFSVKAAAVVVSDYLRQFYLQIQIQAELKVQRYIRIDLVGNIETERIGFYVYENEIDFQIVFVPLG